MSDIEFGIGLRQVDHLATDAKTAEELGYQFISCGEHVFFYGPADNSLIALAAAAGATDTIKLMSTITLVPLYPAALLAKQVATLDRVSKGRFHLGVGVGGEIPQEFEACGVPVRERGARTNEALQLMKRLWTEDDVTFEGRFSSVRGVTLLSKPVQSPHPPIWVSGRSEAAMKRCAHFATGWLPYMYTPEKLAASLATIGKFSDEIGRSMPVTPGIYLTASVHEDRNVAIAMAVEHLSAEYNQDFSSLVNKYALAGNPDDCITRLREYVEAGARTIIVSSACGEDYATENETLLAKTVLPEFKSR